MYVREVFARSSRAWRSFRQRPTASPTGATARALLAPASFLQNHGIRKVSLAPGASTYGLTTTIAGFRYYSATQCTANSVSYPGWSSGQQGYSSGDATSSFFLFPRACSVQPEAPSQLFIADGGGGQRIRVLDLDTMIVSIVAGGGPAYTAANNYPTPVSGFADGQGINGALFKNIFDITFEPTTPGWLYVADRFAVRKVDVRSVGGTYGYVTTLAGGANANSGANGQGSAASFSLLRGGLQPCVEWRGLRRAFARQLVRASRLMPPRTPTRRAPCCPRAAGMASATSLRASRSRAT